MENAYCALITGSAWRQVNQREEAALLEHTPSSPHPTVRPSPGEQCEEGRSEWLAVGRGEAEEAVSRWGQ